ncbi:MAG TPA: hypothetical protein VF219_05770, partial [Vicinamibacterales bacterium]
SIRAWLKRPSIACSKAAVVVIPVQNGTVEGPVDEVEEVEGLGPGLAADPPDCARGRRARIAARSAPIANRRIRLMSKL